MIEHIKFDDVGSFPLPPYVDKEAFNQFYWTAYKAIINSSNIFEHRGIYNYFIHPLLQSFQYKIKAGVEIINYPQHMDMNKQFLKPIADYEIEPDLIDLNKAHIPEIVVIEDFARKFYEKTNKQLEIKICTTGPIELYIKKHNFTIYKDLALNLSKSINSFLKNSIINNKYMKTALVTIDEPSLGLVNLINVSDDELIQIYDKSLSGINVTNQIHLHSLNKADMVLNTENIDVLTSEYAADKSNKIPKKSLEENDKFIRTGISRTNINRILSDMLDAGIPLEEMKVNTVEGEMKLIDSKEKIKKTFIDALDLYGERLKYVGPDCGFTGWNYPEAAYELLHRTKEVIENVRKNKLN